MSSRKFKFISPGIFINEVDRSQLPSLPADVGPALIGRFERGPALKPVQVDSFEQFVEVFGDPIPGGKGGDVFREGNYTAPTYAAYAAQAYLRNNSPVTVVRLVGETHKDATAETAYAGWKTDNTTPNITATSQGGAFGLFVAEHDDLTLTLTVLMSGSSGGFSAAETALSSSIVLSGSSKATITGSMGDEVGHVHSASYATGTMPGAGLTDTEIASNIAEAVNSGTIDGQKHGFSATSAANIVTFTAPGPDAVITVSGSGLNQGGSVGTTRLLALTGTDGTTQYHTAPPVAVGVSGTWSPTTGTLAAIWYLDQGTIELSGSRIIAAGHTTCSAGVFVRPVADNRTFKARITNNGTTVVEETSFDFNPNSPRYIRKRFNTNPTLTNSTIVENTESYFLGETFEGHVKNTLTSIDKDKVYGFIAPLTTPDKTTAVGGDFKFSYTKINTNKGALAKTGWFISQDLSTNFASYSPSSMTKLFRLVGRLTREDVQKKVKISIKDLRKSSDPTNDYGTFTVAIREIKDTDAAPVIVEQFNNCNLNPASDNYIAKRIGDKYEKWDYDSRRYKEYGDYANNSDYIRVEMASDVADAVTNPVLLPFGVFGPPQYKGFQVSPSGTLLDYDGDDPGNATTFVSKGLAYAGAQPNDPEGTHVIHTSSFTTALPTKVIFPELRLRVSSSEGFVIDPTDAYFGVDTTFNSNEFDKTTLDVIRAKPDTLDSHVADNTTTENSWVFSLDNIRNVNVSESYAGGGADVSGAYAVNAVYDATARTNRTAYTNHTSSAGLTNVPINAATASYENVLDAGFDRFTTCLHGGFDALDIMEREPFRNTLLDDGGTEITNYAYNSINVAIDSLRDPERTEFNLVAMPGITNNSLNSKLVRTAENRGDALAIIDPQGGFVPDTEGVLSIEDRLGSVESTVDNMQQNLKLNSSYGAAYYPWVQIRDNVNGATLWAPPSVAAIGALAYSEAVSELWFAPAGFTRGGLSANNAAGIPVIGVRQRLTSKDRDKLYENNINPIATFPAEGIVIFGQKTLQATPSALDRINVRRLTIFLKREISRIAATLLFDQNVQVTWNKFRGQAETFLSGVKAGLGLTDYKVILDETTTTPDLVDRNILYAKIFVKPARAIEFIAIDFIITDSGAAFDD
tara:strand:- start:2885 stop:6313 length:3429 start_codon:yes stop_codon:yes gene_type:complete